MLLRLKRTRTVASPRRFCFYLKLTLLLLPCATPRFEPHVRLPFSPKLLADSLRTPHHKNNDFLRHNSALRDLAPDGIDLSSTK
jgi:hypothetical protein